MAYRKFRATHLFTGKELLAEGQVLVTDHEGTVREIINAEDAGDEIAVYEGIISPAFINTHCHLELSHMKGIIPKGTGLIEFLTRVIKERFFPGEVIQDAIARAVDEIYTSGTIAVADICNSTDSISVKKSNHLHWKNFIEVIGFSDNPGNRYEYALQILSKFREHLPYGHLNSSLVPHAPYSVSKQLFSLLNAEAGEVTTIHNQESSAENELYLRADGQLFQLYDNLKIDPSFFRASGKSSVQTYLPWMTGAKKIILVHNSYLSVEDAEFIKQLEKKTGQQVFFCICLRANEYIESVCPPVELLTSRNSRLTIGTDSYASNDSLSLLDEIRSIASAYPSINIFEILKWATINGAESLQMDNTLGSFEKGKKPGIVFIDQVQEGRLTNRSTSQRIL